VKAIILSVQPQWVERILNGEKTIEIRKSVPKDFKGWVYIYETLSNGGRGQVVARFWFDEHTEFLRLRNNPEINKMGCITIDEIISYGQFRKTLYAWHIKKLEVFDTPKELGEFEVERYAEMPNGIFPCNEPLTKAPRGWQYIEVKE